MRRTPLARLAAAAACAITLASLTAQPVAAQAGLTPRQKEWPLAYFHADEVWQHGTGQGVTVAVVDTGVDAQHPDLVGQVEPGASFGSASGDGTTDTVGHGTGMASLIAGTGKGFGGQGIKGLAYGARILAITGSGRDDPDQAGYAQGIRYAVDHGAKIINFSGGAPADESDLREAVNYASSHDVIVVAAAGNSGDAGNEIDYPAAYPGVVAVSGVDRDSRPWAGSEHGPQIVLAAPATDPESAYLHGSYGIAPGGGTSPAAAWVSGAAAVVRGLHPDWTAGQTIRQLINTAHKPDGSHTRDDHYGYGIVDPLAAVTTPLAPGPTTNPLLTSGDNSQDQAPPPVVSRHLDPIVYVGGAVLVVLLIAGTLIAVLVAKRRTPQRPPQPWPGQPAPPMPWNQSPPPGNPRPNPPSWPPGPSG